jgi:hypothetical protein
MAQLTGNEGQGFGTSSLDVNRQFITPEFYRRFLRRSNMTQEAGDEMTAFSNLLTNEKLPQPTSGSYSLATLQGQERLNEIEGESEALASRLESLRLRQNKIKLPLAEPIFVKELVKRSYNRRKKVTGETVLTVPENIQDMSPSQLILSINYNLSSRPNGLARLKKELANHQFGSGMKPSDTWIQSLKQVAYKMNQDNFISDIPTFPVEPFNLKDVIDSINEIKNDSSNQLKLDVDKARTNLVSALGGMPESSKPAEAPGRAPAEAPAEEKPKKVKVKKSKSESAPAPAPDVDYKKMSKKELQALLKERRLPTTGNKPDLIERLQTA